MIWRLAILCAAISGFGAAPRKEAATDSLRRGVEYLMSQQADDGGWHSTTYGSMKQGAAVTFTAAYALSHLYHLRRVYTQGRLSGVSGGATD